MNVRGPINTIVMRVSDIFTENNQNQMPNVQVLSLECSQFVAESGKLPLTKNLPTNYKDLQKVKVRFRKRQEDFDATFNKAFESNVSNLVQRAIFAYGSHDPNLIEDTEPFYIFPKNGYQYFYSQDVKSSNKEYQTAFDLFLEKFGDEEHAADIFSELLKYNYVSTNLKEGLAHEKEIILYRIPYYYAVRSSLVNYDDLLTLI